MILHEQDAVSGHLPGACSRAGSRCGTLGGGIASSRQPDQKGRAFSRPRAGGANRSSMYIYNGARDGKSQPQTTAELVVALVLLLLERAE